MIKPCVCGEGATVLSGRSAQWRHCVTALPSVSMHSCSSCILPTTTSPESSGCRRQHNQQPPIRPEKSTGSSRSGCREQQLPTGYYLLLTVTNWQHHSQLNGACPLQHLLLVVHPRLLLRVLHFLLQGDVPEGARSPVQQVIAELLST